MTKNEQCNFHFLCNIILNLLEPLLHTPRCGSFFTTQRKTLNFMHWKIIFNLFTMKYLLKYHYCYLQASANWLLDRPVIKMNNQIIVASANIQNLWIFFLCLIHWKKKKVLIESSKNFHYIEWFCLVLKAHSQVWDNFWQMKAI